MSDNNKKQPRIAIIGAGLAGLTCATALKGFADVQVFEKSVFVGGRVSRYQFAEYHFNHGEQYFTVSNPLFQSIIRAWQETGLVRDWDGWIVELDHGQVVNLDNNTRRYIGYPHMQAITDTLAHNCDVKLSTSIAEIEKQADGSWRLFDDRGTYQGLFDLVIIATAAHQVAPLARSVPQIAELAESISMTVCWTAMFRFKQSLNLPFDAAFVLNSPLAWISRFQQLENSHDVEDSWIIHATPEWSQEYVTSFRGRVMHALQDAFFEACDIEPVTALSCNVHCWKHALPINTLDQDCVFDEDAALGACGDWCTSPRIEGAVLSGFSMADRIMKFIGKHADESL
jgi:renalase